jgi:galactosamine-6-phosphate isomerase
MLVTKFENLAALNTASSAFMLDVLRENPRALVCAATGNSPTGAYRQLVARKDDFNSAGLRFIKLDEWASLPMDHPGSCEYYLQQHLLTPLQIPTHHFISFDSMAGNPEMECNRIQHYLDKNGPIDLCVLGLGLNGHLAFNDPAENLTPHVHLAQLSATSLEHPMIQGVTGVTHGYTLGMADLLQSKTIVLMVNGKHKNAILTELLKQQISTQLPASFLWLHANAHCFYCED